MKSKDQIEQIRNEIESYHQAGASTNEIEDWLRNYEGGRVERRDLVEVIRLLVDELTTKDDAAEPVAPGDLKAGDKVKTATGKTRTVLSVKEGQVFVLE